MATKFSEIYPYFLSQIDDYELTIIEEDEFDSVLEKYLVNGLSHLQAALFDIHGIDMEKKEFKEVLKPMEMTLVAKAMKLEWIGEKKNSEELMRKDIGDRDYKAVQGTDYLKIFIQIEKELRKEIDIALNEYSYYAFDDFWR